MEAHKMPKSRSLYHVLYFIETLIYRFYYFPAVKNQQIHFP